MGRARRSTFPLGAGLSAIGRIKEKPVIGKMDSLSGRATVELSGRISLKSCQGLCLSVKGDGTALCDQRTAGENEVWTVGPDGGGIALKSRFWNYLRPEPNGRLTASGNVVTKKETFTVIDHDQGGKNVPF
jgi:hypothetical protein